MIGGMFTRARASYGTIPSGKRLTEGEDHGADPHEPNARFNPTAKDGRK
jgi:hypothetical protein